MNRGIDQSQSKVKRFGSGLLTFAKRAALPAAAALTAAGGAALKFAADEGEALNKANVIFGNSAKQIDVWSKTTANSFGLARAESLEAAAGFGAMLDTAGIARQELAPMSQQLVELASDMASFNNQDPSAMLERLRSGLAGEAEPLRRFGVFISAAAVQTQAYKDGIAKTGKELTEAQKVQARYNLILSQTNKQQGDFARTQNSLPNLMSRVGALLKDLAAKFGRLILPFVEKSLQFVLDVFGAIANQNRPVNSMLTGTTRNFRDMRTPAQKMADVILKIADAIETLINAISRLIGFLTTANSKISSFISAAQKIPGVSGGLESVLRSIPGIGALVGAQHGFHGTVTRPTLFLAGEAGPERVDVTPRGQSSGITINIQNAFGFDDFERKVTKALGRAMARTGAA